MTESLISMQGVTRVFMTDEIDTHALANIDLEILPGEFVSVTGPSGLRQIHAPGYHGAPG